jgi:hypothetical protein
MNQDWPNGTTINGVDTTPESLAMCAFQNQVYLFWKANDGSNQIYFSASPLWLPFRNGTTINGVDSTPAALCACVFQNQLYLFWKANDPSNQIYFSASADGLRWPNGTTINGVDSTPAALTCAPYLGLEVPGNALYLFWQANDPSNRIYYSISTDGQIWPNGVTINNVDTTPQAPATSGKDLNCYLFWVANDPSNRIYCSIKTIIR